MLSGLWSRHTKINVSFDLLLFGLLSTPSLERIRVRNEWTSFVSVVAAVVAVVNGCTSSHSLPNEEPLAASTAIGKRPGVNFTNILRAAFTRADPKSAKKLLELNDFFSLLGSAPVKAAHRMLVKLTPIEVVQLKQVQI